MAFNISDYLKKFEQFLPYESRVKNGVIAAVQEIVGMTLDRKKIRVSGKNVFVQGSGSLKSELAMKQSKILARVKELQPALNIERVS